VAGAPRGDRCPGAPTLLIEKFSGSEPATTTEWHSSDQRRPRPRVETVDGDVVLVTGDGRRPLDRATVHRLRRELAAAGTESRAFVYTRCRHREDGAYVVERRNADSTGHRKVFDSYEACRAVYDALPREFDAGTVGEHCEVTGSRRHVLVRHFAEHPAFDCELAARQPLTAEKVDRAVDGETDRPTAGEEAGAD
jgi:hypothetical protein